MQIGIYEVAIQNKQECKGGSSKIQGKFGNKGL